MKLTTKQAKPIIAASFPSYRGRKITATVVASVTLWDLNWSGGTRNVYKALRMDGATAGGPVQAAPWAHNLEGREVAIPEGCMVVEHSIFCGKDVGIHIYVHPSLAPKLLTA